MCFLLGKGISVDVLPRVLVYWSVGYWTYWAQWNRKRKEGQISIRSMPNRLPLNLLKIHFKMFREVPTEIHIKCHPQQSFGPWAILLCSTVLFLRNLHERKKKRPCSTHEILMDQILYPLGWREHHSNSSTAVCGKSCRSTWWNDMKCHLKVMDRLQFLLQLSSSNHLAHLPLSSWRHHHGFIHRSMGIADLLSNMSGSKNDYLTIWLSCSRFAWVEWFQGWLHKNSHTNHGFLAFHEPSMTWEEESESSKHDGWPTS